MPPSISSSTLKIPSSTPLPSPHSSPEDSHMRSASRRTTQLARHLTHHRTMATFSSSPAPWRADFTSHVSKLKTPNFTLSTLHPVASASSSGIPFTPRCRTVVYRGMWADLPVNPKNTAPLNPEGVYESDLLTVTTDARMEKVPELFQSAEGTPSAQSGKGGPIEALFWIEETNTQWRFRGHALVVGPDIDTEAASTARETIRHYMRSQQSTPQHGGEWSFSRELTAHFGNLSPVMRGTFKNPPPGTPLREKPAPGLELGQKVEDNEDKIARENFRVLVLVPEEVDRVDLSVAGGGKRWNYKLSGDQGEKTRAWKITELWP